MSLLSIRTAIQTRLLAMPQTLTLSRENTQFTPPADAPYQSLVLLPQTPENPTFGNDYYREVGIARVYLYYPLSSGPGGAEAQAEKIRNWFPRGLTLQQDGLDIIIRRTPSISVGSVISNKYVKIVDINYFTSVFI